jgi:hypothetical protein
VIVSCCASPETQKFTDPIINGISHYFSYMAIQLKDTVTASTGFQKGIVAENTESHVKSC